MRPNYKGISFREGYKSFPEFKKELENVHVFRNINPKEREKEMRKAYKIATGKSAKDELQGSDKKSGKPKSRKSDKAAVSGDKKD